MGAGGGAVEDRRPGVQLREVDGRPLVPAAPDDVHRAGGAHAETVVAGRADDDVLSAIAVDVAHGQRRHVDVHLSAPDGDVGRGGPEVGDARVGADRARVPGQSERDRAVAAGRKRRGDANRRGDQVVLVEREGPHLQCQLDRAVGLDPKRDRGVGLDELGDQLQRAVAVEVLGGDADAHAVVPHLEGEAAMVRADRDLHLRRLEVATVDGDLQAGPFLRPCSPRRRPPAPESPPVQGFARRMRSMLMAPRPASPRSPARCWGWVSSRCR